MNAAGALRSSLFSRIPTKLLQQHSFVANAWDGRHCSGKVLAIIRPAARASASSSLVAHRSANTSTFSTLAAYPNYFSAAAPLNSSSGSSSSAAPPAAPPFAAAVAAAVAAAAAAAPPAAAAPVADDDDGDIAGGGGETNRKRKKKYRTWEEHFDALAAYKRKHGDCDVPTIYTDDTALGQWVYNIRVGRGPINDEQRERLDEFGFIWEKKQNRTWEESFDALAAYKSKHGDCNVPTIYTDDTALGQWVYRIRVGLRAITDEQRERLDELGFIWEKKKYRRWEDNFDALAAYKTQHGHCNVPRNYPEDPALGHWVCEARSSRGKKRITAEQEERLVKLGFDWGEENKRGRVAAQGGNEPAAAAAAAAADIDIRPRKKPRTEPSTRQRKKSPGNDDSDEAELERPAKQPRRSTRQRKKSPCNDDSDEADLERPAKQPRRLLRDAETESEVEDDNDDDDDDDAAMEDASSSSGVGVSEVTPSPEGRTPSDSPEEPEDMDVESPSTSAAASNPEPPAERKKVLFLGMSYPDIKQYPSITVKAGDEPYQPAVDGLDAGMTQIDTRDWARILATIKKCNVKVFCISRQHAASYLKGHHLWGNFNSSQRLFPQMHEEWKHPLFYQVVLDYCSILPLFTEENWQRTLFIDMLVSLAQGRNVEGERHPTNDVGSGLPGRRWIDGFLSDGAKVYLPFCYTCFKRVVTDRDALLKCYDVSFLLKANLAEVSLWAGTETIPEGTFHGVFGKLQNQEELHFTCRLSKDQLNEAGADPLIPKEELSKYYGNIEDVADVRFIVLTKLPEGKEGTGTINFCQG